MLKQQFEWDEKNVEATIKYMDDLYGGCSAFFDDLDSQFEKLKSLIPPQAFTKSAQLKAWLLLDCQRQLALMASTFLRGHITDAYGNARRAVELAATMGRILRDETGASAPVSIAVAKPAVPPSPPPDLTTLWFACDSEAGLLAYKREAKMVNLWNDNLSTVATLRTRYGILCTKVHTGAFSIIESIPKDADGKLILDEYKPHQISPDGTELLINFLFLTDCFIQILEALAEIYAVHTDASWTTSINGWRGKRDTIRPVFEAKIIEAGAI